MSDSRCETFFASEAFAVVGAAKNRSKFGNKVLRCYVQHGKKVFPVNPREDVIEGLACIPAVATLPDSVASISVITPPPVTEQVVQEAIGKGIRNIWLQPGAESAAAVAACRAAGINVIADGSCLLRFLGFREESGNGSGAS